MVQENKRRPDAADGRDCDKNSGVNSASGSAPNNGATEPEAARPVAGGVNEPAESANESVQEVQEATPVIGDASASEHLRKLESQRDEYLTMAQRVQADFDNYRRRTHAASLESYDNGRASVIEQVLPVLDNLERAVASSQDETTRAGVALVVKQMSDMLDKWGVAVIDRVGEAFDPNVENAVMRAEPGEGEPGAVIQVFQKGYKLGSRVLRHAMVKVAAE
ncbi:MAG: nucleotide exchange factor GrpE [Oscillospiraceae bacterium]|jgi:molecular chaperone GrpE|nr:nucleotide exchange factor GrpE [Oscillospiraceae bacterium]